MRISELAAASGVPIATIKYYLRERLIPAGRVTSTTRADYDERHVEALALVRSLLAAGLAIAEVRAIVERLEQPIAGPTDLLTILRELQQLLSPRRDNDQPLRQETEAMISRYGWQAQANPAAAEELQAALDAASAAGFQVLDEVQQQYARSMTDIAGAELAHIPAGSPSDVIRYAVLGERLMERVLLAMRRLAEASKAHEVMGVPIPGMDGDQARETSSE